MKDLQKYIYEASINAKKRNVKFIKDLMLNGKNAGRIGSFVIFTSENPNSQTFSKKDNKKQYKDLANELKRCHYIHLPIKGYFAGNEEHSFVVFNMKLNVAKEWNYKYEQTSFFFVYPTPTGFIAEYWEKSDDSKSVDNVRNPYVKKGETNMQHDGEDDNENYSIISNDYKFYFDSSLFENVNNTIERGLDIICEQYNINDKDWLIDHLTNGIGQKITNMKKIMTQ